jgi:hypothetical protein
MDDNREKLLVKIRALLSKTTENGCTEKEELSALAKARAMMDAYEVTAEDLQLTKEEAAILREEPPGTEDPGLTSDSRGGGSPSGIDLNRNDRGAAIMRATLPGPGASIHRQRGQVNVSSSGNRAMAGNQRSRIRISPVLWTRAR